MKTVTDISTALIAEFNRRIPSLDLSEGTEERDIFVEAPIAGALSDLYANNDYNNKLFSPFKNYGDITDSDIESFCANYEVWRVQASYSTGILTYYTYTAPTKDVLINAGSVISTASTPVYLFTVDSTLSIPLENMASYFNGAVGRWEFSVSITASVAGSSCRAGAGAVSVMVTSIEGIQGCVNNSAISGGADAETNESMLNRVSGVFRSRGLHNDLGVKSFVDNYTESYIVGAGDVLMLRDNGHGGCTDVYIRKMVLVSNIDTVVINKDAFDDIGNYYTATSITLSKPPVKSISSVSINGTVINTTEYTLKTDTGVYAKSTKAYDKIELSPTGTILTFKDTDVVEISYIYDSYPYTVAEYLNTSTNKYRGRDYLVREMSPGGIKIELLLQPNGGTIKDFEDSWNTTISNYLSNLPSGSTVTKASIVQIYNGISTIANIKLDAVSITDMSGLGTASSDRIVYPGNVYPAFDSAIYTSWAIL